MVSKASEDFPEPERPVMTVSLSRGISTLMLRRLCARAPRTISFSSGIAGERCSWGERETRRPTAKGRGKRNSGLVELPPGLSSRARLSSRVSGTAANVGIYSPCTEAGHYALKAGKQQSHAEHAEGRGELHGDWDPMRQASL